MIFDILSLYSRHSSFRYENLKWSHLIFRTLFVPKIELHFCQVFSVFCFVLCFQRGLLSYYFAIMYKYCTIFSAYKQVFGRVNTNVKIKGNFLLV